MTSSGFYHYYCGIIAQPNDEEQYEDLGEFDLHLNLTQMELEALSPSIFVRTFFFSLLYSLIFQFFQHLQISLQLFPAGGEAGDVDNRYGEEN